MKTWKSYAAFRKFSILVFSRVFLSIVLLLLCHEITDIIFLFGSIFLYRLYFVQLKLSAFVNTPIGVVYVK